MPIPQLDAWRVGRNRKGDGVVAVLLAHRALRHHH
jgi:hypothetical protein